MAKLLVEERNLIPLFHLPGKEGMFDSSVFKRRKNLVLFFLTDPDVSFLAHLDETLKNFRQENGQAAVITPLSLPHIQELHKKSRLTFPLLSDEKKEVISKFLVLSEQEKAAAVFITDRFGEVFFRYLARDIQELPPFDDIIRSLAFIESQCPECGDQT